MLPRFSAVIAYAALSWASFTSGAAGELLEIGPGSYGPLQDFGLNDYHILAGAKFASPPAGAPPGYIVSTQDALHYGGRGLMRIDGGEFQGGNATYNGPIDSFAEVRGGAGVRITASKVEIHGGHFRGGTANSTSASGSTQGGIGLVVSRSEARIYGGIFEGGRPIAPNAPYSPSNYPQTIDFAVGASTVHLYGGKFSYIVLTSQSVLHVYGRELVQDFYSVKGYFADGTPLWFTVFKETPEAIVLHNVPEPSAACSAVAALSALALLKRGSLRCRCLGSTGASAASKTERRWLAC